MIAIRASSRASLSLAPAARLRVVTREIEAPDELLVFADPQNPTVWSRRGDILVARGTAAAFGPADANPGPREAADWWRRTVATAEIGRGGCLLRGSVPTPARARFSLHLPERRRTLRVEAETIFRLREGPDWSADGVGLRFVSFEAGAEPEWIDYVAQQREPEKLERSGPGA